MSGFRISHGEAVATGVLLDSIYAREEGLDHRRRSWRRFATACSAAASGFGSTSSTARRRRPARDLRRACAISRNISAASSCVTFPRGIGARHEVHEIDLAMMEACASGTRGDSTASPHDRPAQPPLHLTYCLNIHPGETLGGELRGDPREGARGEAARRAGRMVRPRAAACARRPRRSSPTRSCAREALDFFARHQLYPFTINGFPYGRFHHGPVKENVYAPDWRTPRAARLHDPARRHPRATGCPTRIDGSISTVPVLVQAVDHDRGRRCARWRENLAATVAYLAALRDDTGKEIHLGLEPEPDCYLETTAETIAFFKDVLLTARRRRRSRACSACDRRTGRGAACAGISASASTPATSRCNSKTRSSRCAPTQPRASAFPKCSSAPRCRHANTPEGCERWSRSASRSICTRSKARGNDGAASFLVRSARGAGGAGRVSRRGGNARALPRPALLPRRRPAASTVDHPHAGFLPRARRRHLPAPGDRNLHLRRPPARSPPRRHRPQHFARIHLGDGALLIAD